MKEEFRCRGAKKVMHSFAKKYTASKSTTTEPTPEISNIVNGIFNK